MMQLYERLVAILTQISKHFLPPLRLRAPASPAHAKASRIAHKATIQTLIIGTSCLSIQIGIAVSSFLRRNFNSDQVLAKKRLRSTHKRQTVYFPNMIRRSSRQGAANGLCRQLQRPHSRSTALSTREILSHMTRRP